jgi:hypothetical protein
VAGAPVSDAEIIRAGIDAALEDLYVARPGEVTAYDPLTNTAVVKPMVKQALYTTSGKRVFEELPEIPFVPVIFPRAGAFAMTLPVEVGDAVLLVFCDVSLAEWRDSGQLSEPIDARRHSLGWPVAIPGFFPDTSPMSANPVDVLARAVAMILGQHGGNSRIEIRDNEIKIGKDATDYVALAAKVDAGFSAIKTAFSNWVVAPNDGGAALKTAWTAQAGNIVSTSAERTKAK